MNHEMNLQFSLRNGEFLTCRTQAKENQVAGLTKTKVIPKHRTNKIGAQLGHY